MSIVSVDELRRPRREPRVPGSALSFSEANGISGTVAGNKRINTAVAALGGGGGGPRRRGGGTVAAVSGIWAMGILFVSG